MFDSRHDSAARLHQSITPTKYRNPRRIVGENDTACGFRDSKYALVIQARWKSAEEDAAQLAWTQDFFEAMKLHGTGRVYVNFVADEGNARVADAYNPQALARLRAIKAKYDPNNLFRLNQNIRPA